MEAAYVTRRAQSQTHRHLAAGRKAAMELHICVTHMGDILHSVRRADGSWTPLRSVVAVVHGEHPQSRIPNVPIYVDCAEPRWLGANCMSSRRIPTGTYGTRCGTPTGHGSRSGL